MAEYYGKLKDIHPKENHKGLKRILLVIGVILIIVVIIAALIGIFGDTKRRDETREIVTENSELKQEIFALSEENEILRQENAELKDALKQHALSSGNTISKPGDDMSGNVPETEENTEVEDEIEDEE